MAVRTATPWWLSAVLLVGLVFIFLGQRAFGTIGSLSTVLTGLGLLAVVVSVGVRAWAMTRTRGQRRQVEVMQLVCSGGTLLALLGYFLATKTGRGVIGLGHMSGQSAAAYTAAVTTLWAIVMAASIIPLIMAELSLGLTGRTGFSFDKAADGKDAAVEAFRVRDMTSSGLTIALAAGFLMVTCHVANQKNVRKDLSYFKTSAPGQATINIVKSVDKPIKVLLFFPEVNQVKSEVEGYLDSLRQAAGKDKLIVEEHDRMASPKLAKKYRITEDGTVVVVKGKQDDHFTLMTDIRKARRSQLRTLDAKMQKMFMNVIRARRTAYFTTGHGELNDLHSTSAITARNPMLRANLLKRRLASLNYRVRDLGLSQGLAQDVPDDAAIVFVLAPQRPLLPEEINSLDRYLARGGSMLIALDPTGKATLGKLSKRLGIKFVGTSLADDKEFVPRRHNASDHLLILTNQFSAHASVTTLSRGAARSGILLINAGYLVDAPFGQGMEKHAKRTYVIHSMPSTFADLNGNFEYDKGKEKRMRYNLAAAIEDPNAVRPGESKSPSDKSKASNESHGMRVMVFSDGEIFSDLLLAQVPMLQALSDDAIRWLGGEEQFSGATNSEKDVRIRHTQSQDVIWFYATIVGAPLLVLGFGLGYVSWRRRMHRRTT